MEDIQVNSNRRIRSLYALLIVVFIIFIGRLFYLQVIRYDYYQAQAEGNQLKRYEIPATRGTIFAEDGGQKVPLVLNEIRYNIVADPEFVSDVESEALLLADILKVERTTIEQALQVKNSRYEILAKKQTKEVKQAIESEITSKKLKGIFTEKVIQRVYPQGPLAAQTLGFVNDEGEGNYGIEQYLNTDLAGKAGKIRALTDQNGIPLLASGENIQEDPVDGSDVVLTIDVAMQQQLEKILAEGLKNAISNSGSAIIMDPYTGAIKAISNYPSYDPAKFGEVEDASLFTNASVSSPLEPGSIMKVLTTSAALDSGSVTPDQSYYDPSFYKVDGYTVKNIEEDGGAAQRTVSDILRYSLNTGASWLLLQMGNGEFNEKGRLLWNDYMTNHFQLGKITGIEQGYESEGIVPSPTEGFGLNIKYVNTSFGQGMTATPLQMITALASIVNGGTYYKPHLVASTIDSSGVETEKKPEIVKQNVISPEVSNTVIGFMNNVVNNVNRPAIRAGYSVGGKTGTAEIANPAGGYYDDRFNGTYMGFVGGDKPEYVIFVRVNEPKIGGYAGSRAAGPIFASLSNMLIDNFSVKAKTNQ